MGLSTTGWRATVGIAATIVLVSGSPAIAAGDDVVHRGSCSGYSTWKLKAKPDDGRIEVEGEVDSNHNRQKWRWRILHEGWVSFSGKATTTGPSGSFEVSRRVVDSRGKDHIGWRAVNRATGETCRGGLAI